MVANKAKEFSHNLLDKVLKKYVDLEGKVNYDGLKNEKDFKEYLNKISKISPLNKESLFRFKTDKLAYWINTYNALAIQTILDHVLPKNVSGIRKIPGVGKNVWDKAWYTVGKKKISLGDIEHKILRPMKEPRIHFAIVCASISCPPLRQEAYVSDRLESQLKDQTKRFMQDKKYVDIKKGILWGNKLEVSPILKWFAEDFELNGGIRYTIKSQTTNEIKKLIDGNSIKISYKNYNWDLNKQ